MFAPSRKYPSRTRTTRASTVDQLDSKLEKTNIQDNEDEEMDTDAVNEKKRKKVTIKLPPHINPKVSISHHGTCSGLFLTFIYDIFRYRRMEKLVL